MLQDAKRVAERVGALQKHFAQSETDLKDIAVSTEKIIKRSGSIAALELTATSAPQLTAAD